MSKLILEVYLPATQQTFDIRVPSNARLSKVSDLTGRTLTELSGGLYTADETTTLCDRETGDILNINMTVWELGLRNGSKLMLI